jgi:hypothetical protein
MKYFFKLCEFADEQAPWLNELPLSKIPFVNKKPLCASGAFSGVNLTVYFEPDLPAMEFSNIVHELRHAWQYKKYGKLRYLFMKTFMRKRLEQDAWNWEEKSLYWITAKEVMNK